MVIYTTGKIAKIYRCAQRTVVKWCDKGLLKHYRIPGSADRRITKENLIKFAEEHGMPVPDEVRNAS